MISRLKGTLVTKDLGRVEVETTGGVVYEVDVPLSVLERLPAPGSPVEIRTAQVVREDAVALYGFLEAVERELFLRLLTAPGVGPRLAVSMLSALPARRLARALMEKDLTALTQVSGVGKKKAQQIVLALADRVTDLALSTDGESEPLGAVAEAAVSALVSLGYTFPEAERAVRRALERGAASGTEEVIRRALASRG